VAWTQGPAAGGKGAGTVRPPAKCSSSYGIHESSSWGAVRMPMLCLRGLFWFGMVEGRSHVYVAALVLDTSRELS
jgi:hypothetical protein